MTDVIFRENLKALAQRDRQLADSVKETRSSHYMHVPSQDPIVPNLLYREEGGGPVLFYDPRSPLKHSHSFTKSLKLGRARILVVMGIGLGYQLLNLAGALRKKTYLKKMVVVERDLECFRCALEVSDLTSLINSPAVEFVVGVPAEDIYVHMSDALRKEMSHFKALKFVPWPVSVKMDPEYYEVIQKSVSDVATTVLSSFGNDPYDSLVAYEHFLKNSKEVLNGPLFRDIKGIFPNRPAVVVASGPSLNKNIHLLDLIKESAVIVSVDASWKILEQRKINPHFVVTVERTPGTYKFIEGLDTSGESVYAMVSFVFPETLKSYKGPRLFMHRSYNFFKALGMEEDSERMGNSTAHMAFQIAKQMGCDPIILIGQDLAFGESGSTHAAGSVHGQKQIYFLEEESFEVPGNICPSVRTSATWYKFIKQYEQHVHEYPGLCINATEGGARIAGTEVMPFLHAIQKYCGEEFSPRKVIFDRLGEGKGASKVEFLEGMGRIEKIVAETLDCCRKGLDIIRDPLAEAEMLARQGADSLPEDLNAKIRGAVQVVSDLADYLIVDPGITMDLAEYLLQPVGLPFVTEWHVVQDRFKQEEWANAYRLKIAGEFLGATGQLCLSLQNTMKENPVSM